MMTRKYVTGQRHFKNTDTARLLLCPPSFQSLRGLVILPVLGHHGIHLIPYKDKETNSLVYVCSNGFLITKQSLIKTNCQYENSNFKQKIISYLKSTLGNLLIYQPQLCFIKLKIFPLSLSYSYEIMFKTYKTENISGFCHFIKLHQRIQRMSMVHSFSPSKCQVHTGNKYKIQTGNKMIKTAHYCPI